MEELRKAKQKYSEYSRNYYYFKDIVEDHYCGDKPCKDIDVIETKMKHCYDTMEVLYYVFGDQIR